MPRGNPSASLRLRNCTHYQYIIPNSIRACALVAALGVGGCTESNSSGIDEHTHFYKPICIRGVQYWRASRRLAPALKPDGTLYTCGGAE